MKNKNTFLVLSIGFIVMAGCLANAAGQSQIFQAPTSGQQQLVPLQAASPSLYQSNGAAAIGNVNSSGAPVAGTETISQPLAEDGYSIQNYRCAIASSNDYLTLPGDQDSEPTTVKEINLHLIRNSNTGEQIGYSIGQGPITDDSNLETFDVREAMEEYRMKIQSDFRIFEIQSQNAMEDPSLPAPVMKERPMQPSFSMHTQLGQSKGHPNTSLEYTVNGHVMAKLKCNSTLHDVHVNTTSGGEGKAYGQGGARKQAYAINRVHQERWCDSADVEGSLYMETLSRSLKVRCSYSGEIQMK